MEVVPCEDWKEFAWFMRAAYSQGGPRAFGNSGASEKVLDELTSEKTAKYLLSKQKVLLAKQAGMTFGMAAWRRLDGERVEIAGVLVLDSAKRKGIGSALMERALKDMAAAGFKAAIVKTETTNEQALGFYQKFGFEVAGELDEDLESGTVRCVLLGKQLA